MQLFSIMLNYIITRQLKSEKTNRWNKENIS